MRKALVIAMIVSSSFGTYPSVASDVTARPWSSLIRDFSSRALACAIQVALGTPQFLSQSLPPEAEIWRHPADRHDLELIDRRIDRTYTRFEGDSQWELVRVSDGKEDILVSQLVQDRTPTLKYFLEKNEALRNQTSFIRLRHLPARLRVPLYPFLGSYETHVPDQRPSVFIPRIEPVEMNWPNRRAALAIRNALKNSSWNVPFVYRLIHDGNNATQFGYGTQFLPQISREPFTLELTLP